MLQRTHLPHQLLQIQIKRHQAQPHLKEHKLLQIQITDLTFHNQENQLIQVPLGFKQFKNRWEEFRSKILLDNKMQPIILIDKEAQTM